MAGGGAPDVSRRRQCSGGVRYAPGTGNICRSAQKKLRASYAREWKIVRRRRAVLQFSGDFGVVRAPRVWVEGPVALVAEVVHAECRVHAAERETHACVEHQKIAGTGIGRAVHVGVVELVELPSA